MFGHVFSPINIYIPAKCPGGIHPGEKNQRALPMKSTKKGLEPKHISSELVSKSIILRTPESKRREKMMHWHFSVSFLTGNHTPHKPESYQSHSVYNDLVRFVFTHPGYRFCWFSRKHKWNWQKILILVPRLILLVSLLRQSQYSGKFKIIRKIGQITW